MQTLTSIRREGHKFVFYNYIMESAKNYHLPYMSGKITVIALISTMLGCAGPSKRTDLSNPKDLNGSWNLVSILQDTISIKEWPKGRRPYINIDIDKKTVQGYSGCNSFSGDFSLRNDSLKFNPFIATEIGCTDNIEQAFFSRLRRIKHYRIENDRLELLAQDTSLLLFERNQVKDAPKPD